MKKQVLFIQGGGAEEDYEADAKLVASLQKKLGEAYVVHYPHLPNEESLPDFGRKKQIGKEISSIKDEIILVGHSLGASMLLKYLSESQVQKKIAGIFLIAKPFWSGDEDWKQGLYYTRILLIKYRKVFRFFSIIARMMKKYHLIILSFMHKICRKQLSAK